MQAVSHNSARLSTEFVAVYPGKPWEIIIDHINGQTPTRPPVHVTGPPPSAAPASPVMIRPITRGPAGGR
jgi:hypothetical protein